MMSQSLKDEFEQGFNVFSSPARRVSVSGRLEHLFAALGQERQKTLEIEFGSNVVAFPFPEQMLVRNIETLLAEGKIAGAHKLASLLPNLPRYKELKEVLSPPRFRTIKNKSFKDPRPDYHWISNNFDEFEHQWVALKDGELLASAKTLKSLQSKLAETKPTLVYHIQSAQHC